MEQQTEKQTALTALRELRDEVFGADVGSEPNVYAMDYDDLCDLMGRVDRALKVLAE